MRASIVSIAGKTSGSFAEASKADSVFRVELGRYARHDPVVAFFESLESGRSAQCRHDAVDVQDVAVRARFAPRRGLIEASSDECLDPEFDRAC